MLLRDFLNEFELDWAQAAYRSGQIPLKKIKKKKILLVGEQEALQDAAAWSFMAWNDEAKAGIRVEEAFLNAEGALEVRHVFTEEGFQIKEADVVILTGLCCAKAPEGADASFAYLKSFSDVVDALWRCFFALFSIISKRIRSEVCGSASSSRIYSAFFASFASANGPGTTRIPR